MNAKTKAKVRATWKRKKKEKLKLSEATALNKYPDMLAHVVQAQEAAVNIPGLEQRAYRRGLIDALECIIRELR
jgi:hypothetical protein